MPPGGAAELAAMGAARLWLPRAQRVPRCLNSSGCVCTSGCVGEQGGQGWAFNDMVQACCSGQQAAKAATARRTLSGSSVGARFQAPMRARVRARVSVCVGEGVCSLIVASAAVD